LFDTIQPICESRVRALSAVRQPDIITMAEIIYIPNENYNAAVHALAAEGLTPDDIKTALGEFGNIWPESIKRDAQPDTSEADFISEEEDRNPKGVVR
jgi:hypothetical protein